MVKNFDKQARKTCLIVCVNYRPRIKARSFDGIIIWGKGWSGHLPDAEPLIVSRVRSNWKFLPRGFHSRNGKKSIMSRASYAIYDGTYHGT